MRRNVLHPYFSLRKQALVSQSEYSRFRNRVTTLIRKHKESYFQNLFMRNINNIKTTWKNITLLCKSEQNKSIESIFYNNSRYTSDKDIAEIFNNFFVSIAKDIENSLPNTNISPYQSVIINNAPAISIEPCTFDEISNIISSLKTLKLITNTYLFQFSNLFETILYHHCVKLLTCPSS